MNAPLVLPNPQAPHAAVSPSSHQVRSSSRVTEYELQQWMLAQYRASCNITAEPAIVAAAVHAAAPQYEPHSSGSSPIRAGALLLLDVWGELARPGSVYCDIAWVG